MVITPLPLNSCRMHAASPLIAIIVAGLGLAFVFGTAAQRLRLPPLVGYLLAGVVVGPFTPGFVADTHLTLQLAEIGVVLLMFGVGLKLKPAELLSVKGIAGVGAPLQMAAITVLGLAWRCSWAGRRVKAWSLDCVSRWPPPWW